MNIFLTVSIADQHEQKGRSLLQAQNKMPLLTLPVGILRDRKWRSTEEHQLFMTDSSQQVVSICGNCDTYVQ